MCKAHCESCFLWEEIKEEWLDVQGTLPIMLLVGGDKEVEVVRCARHTANQAPGGRG